jgi:predicted nuclease of predicted toxin-antitoxin system
VTLLLDANLSYRILPRLRTLFPGATHVREHGLQAASDEEIWNFAAARALAIVTRDVDFLERSVLRVSRREPLIPKIIRLNIGNASTSEVLTFLVDAASQIRSFLADPDLPHIDFWG